MVRLNKSTRYALYAAMEMAQAGDRAHVTTARVAERYSLPSTVVAKVFQRLVRAGIAVGTRGLGGGYRLAKRPSRVTVLDVVQVFERARSEDVSPFDPANEGGAGTDGYLRDLFSEVDELVRNTFASISLETLVRRHGPAEGIRAGGDP